MPNKFKKPADKIVIWQVFRKEDPVGSDSYFPTEEDKDKTVAEIVLQGDTPVVTEHFIPFSKRGLCEALTDLPMRGKQQ